MLFSWGMVCFILGVLFTPLAIGVPLIVLSIILFGASFFKNAFAPGKKAVVKPAVEPEVKEQRIETLDDWD